MAEGNRCFAGFLHRIGIFPFVGERHVRPKDGGRRGFEGVDDY